MSKINFKYALRDKVRLLEINRLGFVTGMTVEDAGVSYRVAYWNNGKRESEWVYETEIRLNEECDILHPPVFKKA